MALGWPVYFTKNGFMALATKIFNDPTNKECSLYDSRVQVDAVRNPFDTDSSFQAKSGWPNALNDPRILVSGPPGFVLRLKWLGCKFADARVVNPKWHVDQQMKYFFSRKACRDMCGGINMFPVNARYPEELRYVMSVLIVHARMWKRDSLKALPSEMWHLILSFVPWADMHAK